MSKYKRIYKSNDGSSVTVDFSCIAVANRNRVKKNGATYTNVFCPACGEWHILIAVGKRKKVFCSWCGVKLKLKLKRMGV